VSIVHTTTELSVEAVVQHRNTMQREMVL
jgi:hypothetical protein